MTLLLLSLIPLCCFLLVWGICAVGVNKKTPTK